MMTTFFGGVDVTAYCDWYKYLDQNKLKGINDANIVALHQNALFSKQFAIQVASSDRHRKVPILLQYRDTITMGPQGGLAKLGEMVHQPKIDTTKLDLKDGKYSGYYKSHMRELLKERSEDYKRYALTDAEVTLKFLGFFMKQVNKIHKEGLISNLYVPTTLMNLVDRITNTFLNQPFDNSQISKLNKQIFGKYGLEKYLRKKEYNQMPPNDQLADWQRLLKSITNTKRRSIREKQLLIIHKLSTFLARGTVNCHFDDNNHLYKTLNLNELLNKINFSELYKLNPNFVVKDLLNKGKKIKCFQPKFCFDESVEANYRANAYKLKRNHTNELPSLVDIANFAWNKSIFSTYYVKSTKEKIISVDSNYWLSKIIDFKFERTGYYFTEENNYNNYHQKGIKDMTTLKADPVYNQAFEMARRAFLGGQNLCYMPGVIKKPYIFDIDLVSSYVNAGHLIPDCKLSVPALIDKTNLSTKRFISQIKSVLPNGMFTVGVCDIDYKLPRNIRRVPVGVKANIQNATPRYVLEQKRANLPLTSVLDLIRHGATVYFHRIIVPCQKKLDGTISKICSSGKAQDWALQQRKQAKQKYGPQSGEQEFFKLLGNAAYGLTGEGLTARTSRSFKSNKSYYIPLAKSTNPLIAMQYTAIARYQVNFLMDLIDNIYPGIIPSVTTDGFIWCGDVPLDEKVINSEIQEKAPKQWTEVNNKYFNRKFFEFKSKIDGDKRQYSYNTTLVNLKTRFNFSLDGRIRATAGLLHTSINEVYRDLKNNVVGFYVEQHRISSINDMKHRIDNKHLMREWQQPLIQSLSYDDTSYLTAFHVNDDGYGYYETKPFENVEKAESYKANLKQYRLLFPMFNVEYANCFLNLNNKLVKTKNGYKVGWVKEDVPLKGNNYFELIEYYNNVYKFKVLIRYLSKYQTQLDMKQIYADFYKEHYSSFSGFKQAINRAKNKFVNPLVVLKENWNKKFEEYKL